MLPALGGDQDSPSSFTSCSLFWAGHWLLAWTNAKDTIGAFFSEAHSLGLGWGMIRILRAITPSWKSSFRITTLGTNLLQLYHFWNPSFLFWIGSFGLLLFILLLGLIQYLFLLDVMNHSHLLRAPHGNQGEGQGKKRWGRKHRFVSSPGGGNSWLIHSLFHPHKVGFMNTGGQSSR